MSIELFDEMQVRHALTRACNDAGGESEFAQRHNLNHAYVLAARRGETVLSWRLLQALGFMPVRRYVRDDSARLHVAKDEGSAPSHRDGSASRASTNQ